ncbi:hypothetical protein ABPG73_010603 [Tetrahymena malaccensis]
MSIQSIDLEKLLQSLEEQRICIHEVQLIGQGSHKQVYSCRNKNTKQSLIMKVATHEGMIDLDNEYANSQRIKFSPYRLIKIDQMIQLEIEGIQVQVGISEKVGEKSLRMIIDSEEQPNLTNGLQLCIDGLIGLLECYIAGFYHYDVKPENLVRKGQDFYLIDFSSSGKDVICSTYSYSPPYSESEQFMRYDIYSLGITLLKATSYYPKFQQEEVKYLISSQHALTNNQENKFSITYRKNQINDQKLFQSQFYDSKQFGIPLLKYEGQIKMYSNDNNNLHQHVNDDKIPSVSVLESSQDKNFQQSPIVKLVDKQQENQNFQSKIKCQQEIVKITFEGKQKDDYETNVFSFNNGLIQSEVSSSVDTACTEGLEASQNKQEEEEVERQIQQIRAKQKFKSSFNDLQDVESSQKQQNQSNFNYQHFQDKQQYCPHLLSREEQDFEGQQKYQALESTNNVKKRQKSFFKNDQSRNISGNNGKQNDCPSKLNILNPCLDIGCYQFNSSQIQLQNQNTYLNQVNQDNPHFNMPKICQFFKIIHGKRIQSSQSQFKKKTLINLNDYNFNINNHAFNYEQEQLEYFKINHDQVNQDNPHLNQPKICEFNKNIYRKKISQNFNSFKKKNFNLLGFNEFNDQNYDINNNCFNYVQEHLQVADTNHDQVNYDNQYFESAQEDDGYINIIDSLDSFLYLPTEL